VRSGCGRRMRRMLFLSLVVLVGEYRLDTQGAHDAGRDADTGGAGKVLQTKWLVHVSYLFLPRTTVARSVVRTRDEIHRLEREFVLADARGAAQGVRDRAGHPDGSNLTQCSGSVVRGDQR